MLYFWICRAVLWTKLSLHEGRERLLLECLDVFSISLRSDASYGKIGQKQIKWLPSRNALRISAKHARSKQKTVKGACFFSDSRNALLRYLKVKLSHVAYCIIIVTTDNGPSVSEGCAKSKLFASFQTNFQVGQRYPPQSSPNVQRHMNTVGIDLDVFRASIFELNNRCRLHQTV